MNRFKGQFVTAIILSIAILGLSYRFFQSPVPRFSNQPEIPNVIWQLDQVELNGTSIEPSYKINPYGKQSPPQVQIFGDLQKEIVGFDGCNSFRGHLIYSPEDAKFETIELNRTVTGCEVIIAREENGEWITLETFQKDVVFEEIEFVTLLESVAWYEIEDATLKLRSKDGQQVMIFKPTNEQFRFRGLSSP